MIIFFSFFIVVVKFPNQLSSQNYEEKEIDIM